MTTVYPLSLDPQAAIFPSSNFPELVKVSGSSFPLFELLYDAATDEWAYWQLPVIYYGSGNWAIEIEWYAVNASSNNVVWQAALAAITPNADSQDVETKALATLNYIQDAHLGTVGKRLHRAVIALSNLNSVADLDRVWLGIGRDADSTNATDDMANDAAFVGAVINYSDS